MYSISRLFIAYTIMGSKLEVIMNIFSLLAVCLLTFIACNLLWKKCIKRFLYPDKKIVRESEAVDIISEHDQEQVDESTNSEKTVNTKELTMEEDYLYKFFLKHKRRQLRVNKHFLHAPLCRMENLFARTYPTEYGQPLPLKIVSHFPNKLLK